MFEFEEIVVWADLHERRGGDRFSAWIGEVPRQTGMEWNIRRDVAGAIGHGNGSGAGRGDGVGYGSAALDPADAREPSFAPSSDGFLSGQWDPNSSFIEGVHLPLMRNAHHLEPTQEA